MRCKGKTKAGARCKRNAAEDSEFCAAHAAQAGPNEATDSSEPTPEPEMFTDDAANGDFDFDELWGSVREVVVVGTVVLAALTIGRIIRVL